MSRLALHLDATDSRPASKNEAQVREHGGAVQGAAAVANERSQTNDPAVRFGASMTLSALLAACAAALLLQGPSAAAGGLGAAAAACVLAVVCLQVMGRRRALRELVEDGERRGLPPERARQQAKETLNAWMG